LRNSWFREAPIKFFVRGVSRPAPLPDREKPYTKVCNLTDTTRRRERLAAVVAMLYEMKLPKAAKVVDEGVA
jgi:hypothetical protein